MPELAAIAERAPFGRAPLEAPVPASVFIGFLHDAASRDASRQIAALSNKVDTLVADGREVYWFARKGFAESTISYASVEKLLSSQATFRNANTVRRMAAKYCVS
jgi:uncharacterized protein (DUF1697 family)